MIIDVHICHVWWNRQIVVYPVVSIIPLKLLFQVRLLVYNFWKLQNYRIIKVKFLRNCINHAHVNTVCWAVGEHLWSQFLRCVPHHLRPFSRLSMLNWRRSPLVREVTLIGCLNQCMRRETKVRKDMNVFTTWPSGMKQVNTNWNHLSESGVKMAGSRWFIITTVCKSTVLLVSLPEMWILSRRCETYSTC